MAYPYVKITIGVIIVTGIIGFFWPGFLWIYILLAPLLLIGYYDLAQKRHAVIRNFPIIGRFRYLLEMIRPEINQYFIESNTDGTPFNRELRSLVYQRAKRERQTLPFGTQRDVYQPGYEWINHSLNAKSFHGEAPRVQIGGPDCTRPYSASLLNISAMSFGSLSDAAVRALNGGAKRGNFYHNTGEGSVSRHHIEAGGDLVWQIGTGYFGCRGKDGTFCIDSFAERASIDQVKMIEIKLSQGAKPGHGGILPAAKITPEIAAIRGVPLGEDVLSPPSHSAFDTPLKMLDFIALLRQRSGGKPVGIKLCLGNPAEMLAICKAIVKSKVAPDFISVDGGEGGTGAAPLEFSNSIGAPLTDGLVFVHGALTGFDIRKNIRVIASGKIMTGFHMAARITAGADLCNAARAFMFALGCIQARRCNANVCPVCIATQDVKLTRGLVVEDKISRVASFHEQTVEAFMELLAATGLHHPDDLKPWHLQRRVSQTSVLTYEDIYPFLEPGALLTGDAPEAFRPWLNRSSAESFAMASGA
ncbi:MAG: FMN-binding glutamate synthase family protein [Planctomycetota bacterium]|jgi:glutamate synthase domain-containing protein 2